MKILNNKPDKRQQKKMIKPYAGDWKKIEDDIEYSKELNLYWVPSKKTIYDQRSAQHNGLIGMGAVFRSVNKIS